MAAFRSLGAVIAKASVGSKSVSTKWAEVECGLRRLSCSSGGGRRVIDMAARDGELRVFLVAGEVSGDSLASRLMSALETLSPFPVRFAGVGGQLMCKKGLQQIFPMEDIAVMGLWELLPHLNNIRLKLKEATKAATWFQPHVIVTVDSKGFSFRFLKQVKAFLPQEKRPVSVHYVAPSFWAWKRGETRLRKLCHLVDHMLCILPFEEKACNLNGLAATYVGHPLLEDALLFNSKLGPLSNNLTIQGDGDAFRREHGISHGSTVLTLIPGSRLQEVTRMLPIFIQTVELLKSSFTELSIVIPVAPNSNVEAFVNREVQSWSLSPILIPGASQEQKYDAFSASTAALCTSGSAVLELQLAKLPCVVAYRAHFLTEWVIQFRTKLKFISLPNILLNSAIIPEILFRQCTGTNLASTLSKVIHDTGIRERQTSAAEEVLRVLCPHQNLHNTVINELGCSSSSASYPSMIAASAVLYAKKHE